MATLSQVGPAPHSQDVPRADPPPLPQLPRADLLLSRSSAGSPPAGTHCTAGVARGPWPVGRARSVAGSWCVCLTLAWSPPLRPGGSE